MWLFGSLHLLWRPASFLTCLTIREQGWSSDDVTRLWALSFTRCPFLFPSFWSPPFQQVAVSSASATVGMVRPVTGADVGIRRAEIRPGLREIILCKDQDGKVGLRLRAIDNVSRHRRLPSIPRHNILTNDGGIWSSGRHFHRLETVCSMVQVGQRHFSPFLEQK